MRPNNIRVNFPSSDCVGEKEENGRDGLEADSTGQRRRIINAQTSRNCVQKDSDEESNDKRIRNLNLFEVGAAPVITHRNDLEMDLSSRRLHLHLRIKWFSPANIIHKGPGRKEMVIGKWNRL